MHHTIEPIQISPEAHLVQSFWQQPGAPVGVHVNSLVLASREPVVFDTGVAADRFGWLNAVSTVVEPTDVRWIVLTHDDHDHVGNVEAALDMFPHATVVANWWLIERLAGSIEVPAHRMRWVSDGEALDIGDRVLAFERPPIYDNPTTRAVFDASTGLYWGGDLGAAPGPVNVTWAADAGGVDEMAMSFLAAHQWLSPWVELVDDRAYQAAVSRLAHLGVELWASTHAPVYDRLRVPWAVDLLRQVPHAPAIPQPGQADLDAMLAATAAPAPAEAA